MAGLPLAKAALAMAIRIGDDELIRIAKRRLNQIILNALNEG